MWDKRVIRGNTYATVLNEKLSLETKPVEKKSQISPEKA